MRVLICARARRQKQPAGGGIAGARCAGEQRVCGCACRNLKSNLERMGVSNAVVLNETPARIAEALPEVFRPGAGGRALLR